MYPEKLVETADTSLTVLETVMAETAQLNSVKQHNTADVKNSVNFDCIRSTGSSHHIYVPWWCLERKMLISEAVMQRYTKRRKILAHWKIGKKVMPCNVLPTPCSL
jgi:hypothetical protein